MENYQVVAQISVALATLKSVAWRAGREHERRGSSETRLEQAVDHAQAAAESYSHALFLHGQRREQRLARAGHELTMALLLVRQLNAEQAEGEQIDEPERCSYCAAPMTDFSGEVPCCSNPHCECHPG